MRGHAVNLATTALLLWGAPRQSVSLPVTLTYDPADPFAVAFRFRDPTGDVDWVFARELLQAGLTSEAGQGDVRVWRDYSVSTISYALRVDSPFGVAEFRMSSTDVGAFLARTYDSVPDGAETTYDLDDASIAKFLEKA